MAFALTGARIFDGEAFHEGCAVVIEDRRVKHIIKSGDVAPGIKTVYLDGGLLAPGFIDVQVNGGGGALLNFNPSLDVVQTIVGAHRRFGTTGMLPTVITDAPRITLAAIRAVREARQAGMAAVLGIHIEGPFLDPVRRGAHEARYIRAITDEDIGSIAQADCGTVMMTVAPNKVSPEVIKKLVAAGIRVSLGHSEASFAEVQAALDAGATAFTHLFNAMSQMSGREPGMVGAALTHASSFKGLIADGLHVHDAAAKLAIKAVSSEKFMLISDAMPPAAGGPDEFELQHRRVMRVNGRLQLDDGTLAGSNLTMDEAVRHTLHQLGVPLTEALQMASRNPARFLGLKDLGVIAPQALASLVHLDDKLQVQQTWVEGK